MIRINILACSKSGSRFVLAEAGMGFCRLGSLDRRYCSRVRRSSSFPDSSIKGIRIWIPRSFYFLQKPDKSIFLYFVVCNKWSFHHNLNQSNQFTSFCAYILYLSLHLHRSFLLEINTRTDLSLISWEAMNTDWLQQKAPARCTPSSFSDYKWLPCVCIQFTIFCWAALYSKWLEC